MGKAANLGEVDAFLSHSWSDASDVKWNALQMWHVEFRHEHGRDAKVWIDKFCIDQRNIKDNLRCLPVFLSGCTQLVIAQGSTYLSRLWCVVEIFVFIEMGGMQDDLHLLPLATPELTLIHLKSNL